MCGRYAQGFAVRVIADQLERGDIGIDDIRDLDNHFPSFNVAPSTFQPVIRRDRSDQPSDDPTTRRDNQDGVRHILQGMKWGLIPFWTKRPPDAGQLKTINCRDDSLMENRGMWNSMKGRKRCIVPVQGYFEWFKKSPKEKIPHFVKRTDGELLLLGGLYDSVQYEGSNERIYTFTIVTTAAPQSLAWLHDRMPLIFDQNTKELKQWLDEDTWSQDLMRMLRPYEGQLECFPVKKEVGKVGNNSSDFIIPIDSSENRSNIANFFKKSPIKANIEEVDEGDNGLSENNAPMTDIKQEAVGGIKQEMIPEEELPFDFVLSHLETRPLETIDVYTALVEPNASTRVLQGISKLKRKRTDLSHLKRIRSEKRQRTESVTKLEILICECDQYSESEVRDVMADEDVELNLNRIEVSKWPALSQRQYDEWQSLWPLNWRVPAQRKVQMLKSEFDECEPIMASLFEHEGDDLPITAIAYDPGRKIEVARTQDHRTSTGHPLKHAILELCESVAAVEVVRRLEDPQAETQYLLTNLWVFITHEPCTMCTMALLHSRVSRVYFAKPMPKTGGMASNYGIHWRQELNHRFHVFGGWMASSAAEIGSSTSTLNNIEDELFTTHPPRASAAQVSSTPRRPRAKLQKKRKGVDEYFKA